MTAKLTELAERRAALIARIAAQRAALSRIAATWRRPLAVADRGLAAVKLIRNHPALLVGAAAFAAAFRPRRVAGWLRRGWRVWRMAAGIKRNLPFP